MSKPIEHAESSVKRFGGAIADYIGIHEFLDSSQSAVPDLRHRMLTHNAWFITTVMPKIFGSYITNSDGKNVAVQSVCEYHVFEDLQRYPSAQDWAEHIEWQDWMRNLKVSAKETTKTEPAPKVFDKDKIWEDLTKRYKDIKPQPKPFQPWYYDPTKCLSSDKLYKTDT